MTPSSASRSATDSDAVARSAPTATQRECFLAGEGDAFFRRNRADAGELSARIRGDPVLRALRELRVRAKRALEIGAGDGWRLHALESEGLAAQTCGLDPSHQAARDGQRRFGLDLIRGTAERLPLAADRFDLVILGFCLYLCDREDLFRIAAEVDRVVEESGTVVVYDFYSLVPRRTPYAPVAGKFSYKMDYSALFSWNPCYQTIHREIFAYPGTTAGEDSLMVAVMTRDSDRAYADSSEGKGA